MATFDITFQVCDFPDNPKRLTAAIVAPSRPGPDTGAMLFTHGWGGNRFRVLDLMQYAADAWDLVCVFVEYRQSGYDCDPVDGDGWDRPYDASFHQVFDVLNGLRTALSLYPHIDRRRLFHYGCSQGGHIALLSSIFAPHTFACVYDNPPAFVPV